MDEMTILEIKLIGLKNFIDMSYMLSNCNSLIFWPDISMWKTENVANISMFFSCDPLTSFHDISKWNSENFIDMSYMFFLYDNLTSSFVISNQNTIKAI